MSKIGRNEPCPCSSGKKYKKCCLQKKSGRNYSNQYNDETLNKRFNRYELTNDHYYIGKLGYERRQADDYFKKYYSGYIKCKLVHKEDYSIIVPDQIYIDSNPLLWIQPLAFFACILIKIENKICCKFDIDISCGHMIRVIFDNTDDYIKKYSDGSNLFKCKIEGPLNLEDYATGIGYFAEDMTPYLKLYHHTNEYAKKSILECKYFKPSSWNIQGTKQLENVGYTYFTCLDSIKHNNDLKQIAMASNGKIELMTDSFDQQFLLLPGWEDKYKNEILSLKVYRESTEDRRASIEMNIDSSILSPQHLYQHKQKSNPVFFQICNPFIYRIGIEPDAVLRFTNNTIEGNDKKTKVFKYVILGDARTIFGLEAPYDEENTTAIAKIEIVNKKSNILNFWFDRSNRDHFSGKDIEFHRFKESV